MDTKAIVPFSSVDLLRKLAQKLHQRGETGDAQTLASAIASIVQATGAVSFYGDTFFGGCPECGDCEEVLPIGRKNYAVCHEHRVYWHIGVDHFSRSNSRSNSVSNHDSVAGRNQAFLASYTEIPPAHAFSKDGCPCCGLFVEHAPWCMAPGPKRP